jgi:thymidylate synthase (FAD)
MMWNDGGDVESEEIDPIVRELTRQQLDAYMQMVAGGVAPEEARIVLPLNTMTTVTWTGSLLFWSRVCNQRVDSHAQKAANELASKISNLARPLFPVSWDALVGDS